MAKKSDNPYRPPFQFEVNEPLLVELVCDGCMDCIPKHVIGTASYLMKNLDKLPEIYKWDIRHVGPVYSSEKVKRLGLPSGYAFCGNYIAIKVWRQIPTIEETNGEETNRR